MKMFWKLNIITTAAILLCGSCSNGDRNNEVITPEPEPPVVTPPQTPENNYTDAELIKMV